MQIKDSLSRLDNDKRQKITEIVRFGVVGVAATAIQYGIYLLLLRFIRDDLSVTCAHLFTSMAMAVGYFVSFVFNFYASTRFTFRVKANAKRGVGFVFSHIVNFFLQMLTLNFFIWLGLNKQMAAIPMFCI